MPTNSKIAESPSIESSKIQASPPSELAGSHRLVSLDFFRGLTMFLLIGESTHLYDLLVAPQLDGTLISAIGHQFHHHPWNGLRFWDLIQPFFMFIVGVAMPFSIGRRWERGDSWKLTFRHALQRSFWLLFFGWALYCIGPGRITFELWNVLAQLSVTYLIAFLMMRRSATIQISFTFVLLLITELLYRLWPVQGFNQPFVPDHNFGSYVDMLLMRKLSQGHWVAFNAIPTTVHTMWGVLAGQLLKSAQPWTRKVQKLMVAGAIGIVVGYGLNAFTPIIKRICTSSFVIVSGGWCLLALAVSYWLVDVKRNFRGAKFFTYVGMNSLLIYLFTETGGSEWIQKIVQPFTTALVGWIAPLAGEIATSLAVWAVLWFICFWLFQRRIFVKI